MSQNKKRKLIVALHIVLAVALFIYSLITLQGGPDSVCLIIAAVLLLPIEELQDWLNEKFGKIWVKYLVIGVLVALGVIFSLTEKKDKIYTIDQSQQIIEGIEQGILEDEGMTEEEYIESK